VNHILIGSSRKEVCKLFEMLLWQPDRVFSNAGSLERCLTQINMTPPDLLVIDGSIDTPELIENFIARNLFAGATREHKQQLEFH